MRENYSWWKSISRLQLLKGSLCTSTRLKLAYQNGTRRTRVPNIDRSFYDEFKELTAGRIPVHEVPLASLLSMPRGYLDFDSSEQNEEWKDFFGSSSSSSSGPGVMYDAQRDTLATIDGATGTTSFTSGPGSVPAKRAASGSAVGANKKRATSVSNPTSSSPSKQGSHPAGASGSAKPDSAANILSASLHPSLPPNVVLSNLPQPRPEIGSLFRPPYHGSTLKGWKPSGILVVRIILCILPLVPILTGLFVCLFFFLFVRPICTNTVPQ